MRNCDFWNKDEAVAKRNEYLAQLDLQRAELTDKGADCQPMSLLDWLYKSADTALQYKPGMIVQVRIHGMLEYARVTKMTEGSYRDSGQKPIMNRVWFVLADGKETWEKVPEEHRVYPANMQADKMKDGDIKLADIPQEFLKLAGFTCGFDLALEPLKAKCPFKDEYKEPVPPCMKEEDDE